MLEGRAMANEDHVFTFEHTNEILLDIVVGLALPKMDVDEGQWTM